MTETLSLSCVTALIGTREDDFKIRVAAKPIVDNPGQLRLFALQPERMPRLIGDISEIKLRDQAVATVAVLEFGRNQALRDQRFDDIEVGQHVESGGMKRRGARFRAQIGAALEHRHGNAVTNEIGSGHKPDRAGAGNQNSLSDGINSVHSALIPAALTIGHHFSISAA